jgi:putative toxin-antitoxin system antitoxin component (TIGR02293 family)
MGKARKSRPRATPKTGDESDDRLTGPRESLSAAHPPENVISAFLAMAPIEQAQQIRQGMDANVARSVSKDLLNVSLPVLLRGLHLSPSVVRRKISSRKPLSASESDRIARTVLIHELAADVLESSKLASEWMLKRNAHLRDETPLDMLDTQAGYDCVRDVLIRLAHGVCA